MSQSTSCSRRFDLEIKHQDKLFYNFGLLKFATVRKLSLGFYIILQPKFDIHISQQLLLNEKQHLRNISRCQGFKGKRCISCRFIRYKNNILDQNYFQKIYFLLDNNLLFKGCCTNLLEKLNYRHQTVEIKHSLLTIIRCFLNTTNKINSNIKYTFNSFHKYNTQVLNLKIDYNKYQNSTLPKILILIHTFTKLPNVLANQIIYFL